MEALGANAVIVSIFKCLVASRFPSSLCAFCSPSLSTNAVENRFLVDLQPRIRGQRVVRGAWQATAHTIVPVPVLYPSSCSRKGNPRVLYSKSSAFKSSQQPHLNSNLLIGAAKSNMFRGSRLGWKYHYMLDEEAARLLEFHDCLVLDFNECVSISCYLEHIPLFETEGRIFQNLRCLGVARGRAPRASPMAAKDWTYPRCTCSIGSHLTD